MGDKAPIIGITTDIDDKYILLKQYYVSAILKAGGLPFLIAPAKGGLYSQRIDGLIISGGADLDPKYYNEKKRFDMKIVSRKRTDFEIALIYEIIGLKKPMLGICYGMQVINVALGGSLYQDIGSEVKGAVNHRKSHNILIKEGWHLKAGRYKVNSNHHQSVKVLGEGLEILASSSDGLIEAFYKKGSGFLLGVQWHPERTQDRLSSEIFKSFIRELYASK